MTTPISWQENNARQLASELAKLRQRLEHFAQRSAMKPAPVRAGEMKAPTKVEPTAPPAEELNQNSETPLALELLVERLGLAPFERNVLFLCAAMELDTRVAALCARAHNDPAKPYPTFALALALFDEPSWDVLSPERPLRFWRLIEIVRHGVQPLTASALRADEWIVNYLKGLDYLDERMSSVLSQLEYATEPAALSLTQNACVEIILRRWQQAAQRGPLPVVQLTGPDALSKQLVARQAAAALNRRLYRLPVESLPASHAELETLARLWQRESRLLPLALYLDAEELTGASVEGSRPLDRFLSWSDGVIFIGVREALPRLGRGQLALDIAKPAATEQQAAWSEALGKDAPGSPAQLAAQFNLNLAQIHELARLAREEVKDTKVPLAGQIWEICRTSERPRMDALAQRLETKATWGDLVLPDEPMSQLQQITAQVAHRNQVYHDWGFARKMNRGFSISALFAGDSGTGKTMAAEVIANALRLDLYRIDLSAVVNKYIGETEKNLRRLFDAAEDGSAILFFDEADALFGKRSEVKDSHDRYANIEINYLLQRIESYHGLAILATNMKAALDAAFLRRLRFVVNFPYPGAADRRRLWENVFLQPDVARNLAVPPLDKLDYDRLAKLNLSGGHIHNAALNSAFRAAAEGSNVTMRLVLDAVRTELLKLDRPINEAEFRWTEPPAEASRAAEKNNEPFFA